ncbi:anticodon nuclease, partial [Pseudomonas simiae]|nr:anticodon nuclease [Pseudomonas simiae]
MGKELNGIAQELKAANKKVQLIYAFNGTGKTRLSLAFKKEITPRINNDEGNYEREQLELTRNKILYYNALTEDLFYWDNDLQVDVDPKHKLKIQPNTFTFWLISLLKDLGEDGNIVANFQRYTSSNATPEFNEEYKYKG